MASSKVDPINLNRNRRPFRDYCSVCSIVKLLHLHIFGVESVDPNRAQYEHCMQTLCWLCDPKLQMTVCVFQPKPKMPKAKKLKKCQYGSKCYRKNPQHLRDYSHSSDEEEIIVRRLLKLYFLYYRPVHPPTRFGSQTKRSERKRNRTKHNRENTSDKNVTDDLAPKFI